MMFTRPQVRKQKSNGSSGSNNSNQRNRSNRSQQQKQQEQQQYAYDVNINYILFNFTSLSFSLNFMLFCI